MDGREAAVRIDMERRNAEISKTKADKNIPSPSKLHSVTASVAKTHDIKFPAPKPKNGVGPRKKRSMFKNTFKLK